MIYQTRGPKTHKDMRLPNDLIDYVYQVAGEDSFTVFIVKLIEAHRKSSGRICRPPIPPATLAPDGRPRSNAT